jgi:hypothetical protein
MGLREAQPGDRRAMLRSLGRDRDVARVNGPMPGFTRGMRRQLLAANADQLATAPYGLGDLS